jgi:hypothetical protein
MKKSPNEQTVITRRNVGYIQHLLTSKEVFVTTLLVICFDLFAAKVDGPDSFLGDAENPPWTPDTVAHNLGVAYKVDIPEYNVHKIMAGVSVLTSDDFFRDTKKFNWLCNVYAGDESGLDPTVYDPATCGEMAWAITEVMLLRELPDDYGPMPFSDEIRKYIGFMLDFEGIVNPPTVLQIGVQRPATEDPLSVWADDPEMFEAAYQQQQGMSQSIANIIIENMSQLLAQLEKVPLMNGSTKNITDKITNSPLHV